MLCIFLSLAGAATNISLLTTKFCRHKHVFVATKHVFCPDKIMQISFSSRQTYFCRDKDVFIATKMIPVAAPANDIVSLFLL